MKIASRVLLVLFVLMFLFPFSAKADGGIFYPENFPVYENGQKAFIYLHDGTEDLVVQPSYKGSAKDFVWVVPTPSQPEVNKSSQSVFTSLQKLTIPDNSIQPMPMLSNSLGTTATSDAVQIIEEKTIDSYDIVTLKASSETALSDWMTTNKYSYPTDKNYLLSDYINQGWYFVIAKIRTEAQTDVQADLNNGTITPIRFTFKSDKMIYPMKLTGVAMDQLNSSKGSLSGSDPSLDTYYRNYGTDLTLYTLSDHRMDNSQLNTTWANWLSSKDIKKILAESTEQSWIQSDKKLFLTKMYSYVSAEQIKDDIVLANYQNNDIYPTPFYKESYYWSNIFSSLGVALVILFLSPLFMLFVIISLKEKYDEKWSKKGKWFKLALLSFFLILAVLFLLAIWMDTRSYNNIIEEGSVVGSSSAFIIIEFILAVLTIKDFRRQKVAVNQSLSNNVIS
jgi:hypothetical protein